MRSRPTRIAAAIVLAGLVAVAGGCGGGSKNSTPGTTPSASTPTTSSGATTSSSSGSAPSFASAKNCQDLADLGAKVASTLAASSSGNLTNVLQTESNELKALAQAAPSDIRGDFQTFSTSFSGFLQALQKSGYKPGSTTRPTAAQIAALSTAARSFNSPKLKQAEQHLTAWAHQNCKGVHVGG